MEWDFTIQYKKGCEMPADFLSRYVVESIKISDEDLGILQENTYSVNQSRACYKNYQWNSAIGNV